MDKSKLGYCLKDENGYQLKFHVCGYTEDNKITIQKPTENNLISMPRRYKIYQNKKGDYFVINKKRFYI